MKTRIHLAALLLLTVGMHLSAKEVTQATAQQVASRFASSYAGKPLRAASSLQLVYTATASPATGLRAAAQQLFYIYNVEAEGGFVVVSGDDATAPILAWSDTGTFNALAMPTNLQSWLHLYENEIAEAIEHAYTPSPQTTRQWAALLTDAKANATTAEQPIVLLPTASWDQGSPYNDLCPIDSGFRSATGCVATSMGIIMKHNQWPQQGLGSNSYTTATKKFRLDASFDVAYDWANMTDRYETQQNQPLWNATQAKAVATLLYHCGVATNMDYSYDGSATSEWDAVNALIKHFSYDPGMYLAYRELYTAQEWDNLLRNELNEGRLLLYGGETENEGEGHEFIIDGYSPNYYHVNWGWGGWANGYFLLTSLDPLNSGSGFNLYQDVVIGLQKGNSQPNHELYFAKRNNLLGISADVDAITPNIPFKITYSYISDYGNRTFDGQLGFFLTDKAESQKTPLYVFDYSLPAGNYMYSRNGTPLIITSAVSAGDKIRMYYKSDGHDWKPIRGLPGAVLELPVKAADATSVDISASSATEGIQAIKVYDLSGRLLLEQTYPQAQDHLSIPQSQLPSGAYILSIQSANQWSNQLYWKRKTGN